MVRGASATPSTSAKRISSPNISTNVISRGLSVPLEETFGRGLHTKQTLLSNGKQSKKRSHRQRKNQASAPYGSESDSSSSSDAGSVEYPYQPLDSDSGESEEKLLKVDADDDDTESARFSASQQFHTETLRESSSASFAQGGIRLRPYSGEKRVAGSEMSGPRHFPHTVSKPLSTTSSTLSTTTTTTTTITTDILGSSAGRSSSSSTLRMRGPTSHSPASAASSSNSASMMTTLYNGVGQFQARASQNRGVESLRTGEYGRAVSELSQAIKLEPNDVRSLIFRAQAYSSLGRLEPAIEDYTAAILKLPRSCDLYQKRADAYADLGDMRAAIQDYTTVLSIDAGHMGALLSRGKACQRQGQLDLAVQDFSSVIEKDLSTVDAYRRRADVYQLLHKYDLALKDLDEIVRLEHLPDFRLKAHMNRALLRLRMAAHQDSEVAPDACSADRRWPGRSRRWCRRKANSSASSLVDDDGRNGHSATISNGRNVSSTSLKRGRSGLSAAATSSAGTDGSKEESCNCFCHCTDPQCRRADALSAFEDSEIAAVEEGMILMNAFQATAEDKHGTSSSGRSRRDSGQQLPPLPSIRFAEFEGDDSIRMAKLSCDDYSAVLSAFDTRSVEALQLRAFVRCRLGQYTDALKDLDAALQFRSLDVGLCLEKTRVHGLIGDADLAEGLVDALVESRRNSNQWAHALFYRALLRIERGRLVEAVKDFSTIVSSFDHLLLGNTTSLPIGSSASAASGSNGAGRSRNNNGAFQSSAGEASGSSKQNGKSAAPSDPIVSADCAVPSVGKCREREKLCSVWTFESLSQSLLFVDVDAASKNGEKTGGSLSDSQNKPARSGANGLGNSTSLSTSTTSSFPPLGYTPNGTGALHVDSFSLLDMWSICDVMLCRARTRMHCQQYDEAIEDYDTVIKHCPIPIFTETLVQERKIAKHLSTILHEEAAAQACQWLIEQEEKKKNGKDKRRSPDSGTGATVLPATSSGQKKKQKKKQRQRQKASLKMSGDEKKLGDSDSPKQNNKEKKNCGREELDMDGREQEDQIAASSNAPRLSQSPVYKFSDEQHLSPEVVLDIFEDYESTQAALNGSPGHNDTLKELKAAFADERKEIEAITASVAAAAFFSPTQSPQMLQQRNKAISSENITDMIYQRHENQSPRLATDLYEDLQRHSLSSRYSDQNPASPTQSFLYSNGNKEPSGAHEEADIGEDRDDFVADAKDKERVMKDGASEEDNMASSSSNLSAHRQKKRQRQLEKLRATLLSACEGKEKLLIQETLARIGRKDMSSSLVDEIEIAHATLEKLRTSDDKEQSLSEAWEDEASNNSREGSAKLINSVATADVPAEEVKQGSDNFEHLHLLMEEKDAIIGDLQRQLHMLRLQHFGGGPALPPPTAHPTAVSPLPLDHRPPMQPMHPAMHISSVSPPQALLPPPRALVPPLHLHSHSHPGASGVTEPSGNSAAASYIIRSFVFHRLQEFPDMFREGFGRVDTLLRWIGPSGDSQAHRLNALRYVTKVIEKAFGKDTSVLSVGSYPLRTYLPDGDIDVCLLLDLEKHPLWYLKINEALCVSSVTESQAQGSESSSHIVPSMIPSNPSEECIIRNVSFINAEVKLVHCTINNISVDITATNRKERQGRTTGGGGAPALCLFNQADSIIGNNHLFKRSLILIKGWCQFESKSGIADAPLLGAKAGGFSTLAINIMVLSLFNQFGPAISHPFVALALFLDVYCDFDWRQECITIFGPISTGRLQVGELPKLYSHYFAMRNPPSSPDARSASSGGDSPPTVPAPWISPALLGQLQSWKGATLLDKVKNFSSASLRESSHAASSSAQVVSSHFQFRHCNVVDPINPSNNCARSVTAKNLMSFRKALAIGRHQLASLLHQAINLGRPINILELDDFFGNLWMNFGRGDGWRPDVLFHPRQRWVPTRFRSHPPSNGNKGSERKDEEGEEDEDFLASPSLNAPPEPAESA